MSPRPLPFQFGKVPLGYSSDSLVLGRLPLPQSHFEVPAASRGAVPTTGAAPSIKSSANLANLITLDTSWRPTAGLHTKGAAALGTSTSMVQTPVSKARAPGLSMVARAPAEPALLMSGARHSQT